MADSSMHDETAEASAAREVERKKAETVANVHKWLRDGTTATLCTLSAKPDLAGWPFGSIVPYALDAKGRPFILIAKIAAHTANLRRDDRATLFVSEPRADDPQAGWRIGVMGRMRRLVQSLEGATIDSLSVPITTEELTDLDSRYLARVPGATTYKATHGFELWRMEHLERIRYIAGFGEIGWLDGSVLLDAEPDSP